MANRMRVSTDHWMILMDFAEQFPEVITNKFSTHIQGKQKHKELWETLCTQLNSLGQGFRSVEQWKKCIADWKSKTKLKASRIKMEQNKTGGGTWNVLILTHVEERLLGIMGTTGVYGDNTVAEQGIKRKIDDSILFNIDESGVSEDMPTVIEEYVQPDEHDYYILPDENVLPCTSSTPRTSKSSNTCTSIMATENMYQKKYIINNCHRDESNANFKTNPTLPIPTINNSTPETSINVKADKPKKKTQPNTEEMHLDILKVLKNIDNNMTDMAESLRKIAHNMCNQ